jgi:hypothetical protein
MVLGEGLIYSFDRVGTTSCHRQACGVLPHGRAAVRVLLASGGAD